MTLGTRIATRRRELNISQRDLAKTLGISPSYLCKIERYDYTVSQELLSKIHIALKMGTTINVNESDEISRLETRITDIIRELELIRRTLRVIGTEPIDTVQEEE